MNTKLIKPEHSAFIRFEIENGDGLRKKNALQEISKLYRSGLQFSSEVRNGVELIINGILASKQEDKVVRWCLNCIAQMGTMDGSVDTVEAAFSKHDGKPEIIAAAVAAAARLYRGNLEACTALQTVQPEMRTLAALQVTNPKKLDLRNFKIDINNADDEIIKLALITVGLNRAHENLFDPSHTNGALVKDLCTHPNIIIKQYSVCSIIENKSLNIGDLGISYDLLENEKPNVQSKLLQLGSTKISDFKERHDVIERGSRLTKPEAREGLAKGLQHSYYDGLEEITLDWYDVEISMRVKSLLAEHFSRFAIACPLYYDKAVDIFDREPSLKTRLFLGAEGSSTFSKLKALELGHGTPNLFDSALDPLTERLMVVKKMKTITVLMMCASPIGETPLRLDQEARDLKEQLQMVKEKQQNIIVEHAWAIRNDQIQTEVLNAKPEILHFSGHGNVDRLYFEDKTGQAIEVSAVAIGGLVRQAKTIDCVILNACYSDSLSVALKPHVSAIIGCSSGIDDDAAVVFSSAFYRTLANGKSYKDSFEWAINELEIRGMNAEAKIYTFTDGDSPRNRTA